MTYVLIECGSSARGDTNPDSDRDLVCIWKDSLPDLNCLKKEYGEIMVYSETTIQKMKTKGSLFIAHLDIDGKYVLGSREILQLLRDFKPDKKEIFKNSRNTKEFVKNINWYPDSKIGFLWLLDVLYVALRNFILCKNAMKNVYNFSFIGAIRMFGLKNEELNIMLLIREGKYAYRKGQISTPILLDIGTIETICTKILRTPISLKNGGNTEWKKITTTDYWSERLIERAILNGDYSDENFMRQLQSHNYNKISLSKSAKKILDLQQNNNKR